MSHTAKIKSVPIRSVTALRQVQADLNALGVKCELRENAVPRLFYSDQLQRHLGRKNEIADFVLHLPESRYDLAFIREEGKDELTPVFDDYAPAGTKGVKHVLGAKYEGPVEHWSGAKEESPAMLYSIGKFLQSYTKCAAIEAATAQGYSVMGSTYDTKGNLQLTLGVF